ncbi:MAG: beta-galactosidase [Clostridia bacterium]|nr:beta-galactosidase [Clostridia bacterium]
MSRIVIEKDAILIDGEKTKIMSGAMHYFRVVPKYWKDRLLKLKELGCNCVETYVCWNCHEEKEGEFNFKDNYDLAKFLDLAKEMGLYAVVRPGPYICSEWDFGGLPWWLLKYKDLKVRCYDKLFLRKCEPYLKNVCKILKSRQIDKGGNIIAVQVENEYGSYGNDKEYLNWLKNFYIKNGLTCAFITSDGETEYLLNNGTLPDVWASVNYRNESERCISMLKKYHGGKAPAVMELWNGRAQHWGEKFIRRDIEEVADSVDKALDYAEFVNLYMYHGGTTFGFKNGAEDTGEKFIPQMTSYDVDAPVNEYGVRTPKYYAEQKVICKKLGITIKNTATDPVFTTYELKYQGSSLLNESLAKKNSSATIKSMEDFDQGYGYIKYSTTFFVGEMGGKLILPQVHDIANVYFNGKYIKSIERYDSDKTIEINNKGEIKVDIFVENLGRVNYGPALMDRKGLVGDLIFHDKEYLVRTILNGYKVYSYDLKKLPNEYNDKPIENEPAFYRYTFDAKNINDTILMLEGFTRGVAFINGFNLGRHFNYKESENKLFIPSSFIKEGENEIVIFDSLHNKDKKTVKFVKE